MRAAMFFDAGEGMVAADEQLREGFIVLQENVVTRAIAADVIGLHQQGFGFAAGGGDVHIGHLRHHEHDARGKIPREGITRHAFVQILRLAHIEDFAFRIHHAVDTGRVGNGFERSTNRLRPDMFGRGTGRFHQFVYEGHRTLL